MRNDDAERATRYDETFDEAHDTFFLTRWLSLHTFILLYRSFKQALQRADMFNMKDDMLPQHNLRLFRQAQEKYRVPKSLTKGQSLQTVMLRGVLWDLIVTGAILTVLSGIMSLSGPIAVKRILAFLINPHSTTEQQRTIQNTVVLWMVVYFCKIFLNQLAERQFILASGRSEQTLSLVFHEKILQLPVTYRLNMKRGSLLATVNNEIRAIRAFALAASSIFSAPAILIAIQILVFVEFEHYGIVLTVGILLGVTIQISLAYLMHQRRWRKIRMRGVRMGKNLQMMSSMKDLKLLGWEELLISHNVDCRKIEIDYCQGYYSLGNLWDLVISMAPLMIVLFIEALKKHEVGKTLGIPSIYLILSYIGLIYLPSKSFLVAYVKGLEASKALNVLDRLFGMEELKITPTKTPLLSPGDIVVKNLYATSLDIGQDRRSTANFLPEQEDRLAINTRKTKFASVEVPMEIRLKKGDRLLLLSDSDGGKSSLIRAISGYLKIERGVAWYNGKIATITQKLWFRKKSIRDNVCFGEPVDEAKLEQVYKLCGLDAHLRGLPKGDLTLVEPAWSSTKKLKIALARALYSEPDIIFLDEPFASIDPETAQITYDHICKILSRTTLIISTQVTAFIHPEDRVLLLNNREAVEYGRYGAMLRDFRQSYISKMLSINQDHSHSYIERQLQRDQQIRKRQEREVRLRKIKAFLRCIREIARTKTDQQITQMIRHHSNVYEERKAAVDNSGKRQPAIAWEFYEKFFGGAPLWWFIVMYCMMVLAQAFRAFSEWWLGLIKYHPYYLSSYQALAVYIGSALICGLLLGVIGFLSPIISGRVAATITTRLAKNMASCSFEFFETENPLRMSIRINRDVEQFFQVTTLIQTVLKNLLSFVTTVILLSLRAPILFPSIALLIVVINICILKVYINTDRELFAFRQQNNEIMANTLEEAINGIDLFRTYNKLDILRKEGKTIIYRICVQSVNYRFAGQAVSIICELSGLIIIGAAAFFAIHHKFKANLQQIAVFGTAISFSLRMTNIASNIVRDITRIDNLMKLCMKSAYEIIGKNQEKLFDEPPPPQGWPADSSVEMNNVTLQYASMKRPAVSNVNMKLPPGSRVAVCGKGGSGKGTILAGLARMLVPTGEPPGVVKVGGIDTKLIGRKHYSRKVVMLTAFPMIFSGSVRENLDPFDEHSDQKLRSVLESVELWDEINTDEISEGMNRTAAKLEFMLSDGGAQLTQNQQQRLNIARTLLMKPTLLICDNFTSNLDMIMKERLLNIVQRVLRQTTIVLIPESVKIAVSCDWVVYLSRGCVKEEGTPRDLIARNQGFANLVRSGSRFFMFVDRPHRQHRSRQDPGESEMHAPSVGVE